MLERRARLSGSHHFTVKSVFFCRNSVCTASSDCNHLYGWQASRQLAESL